MRSTFFRDVIYPVCFIIFFVFFLGYYISANGETSAVSSNRVGNIKVLENNELNGVSSNISSNKLSSGLVYGDVSSIEAMQSKIDRLEMVINSKSDLRMEYHGGAPIYLFETNLETKVIQRVDRYPDGYLHIEKGTARKLLPPEDTVKREISIKKLRQSRIDTLKQRIETLSLSSNAVDMVNLAKCQRLLERLERGSTTNYVDVVVTPQKTQD